MKKEHLELITNLRHTLHAYPELAGEERRTKVLLIDFLKAHTALEIVDMGRWFYAAHREGDDLPGIAFRADFDAVPAEELPDGAAHRCGHDGHAAALCGFALMLEGEKLGKNIFLLFQHGEEAGCGGEECCALFDRERVDEIYGAHNLPGFPFSKVLTRTGAMACGSCGMTIRYTGAPAHAAYPDQGINPAPAVGALLQALPALSKVEDYDGMVLCTVIGCRMGEKAFGMSASSAEIWLTLRSERGADLEKLRQRVTEYSAKTAEQHNLTCIHEWQDVFPTTENDTAAAVKILNVCEGETLVSAMRWSEDFGWYLKRCRGAFFGIGCGEEWPRLHTKDYEYPDALLPITAETFYKLAAAPVLTK